MNVGVAQYLAITGLVNILVISHLIAKDASLCLGEMIIFSGGDFWCLNLNVVISPFMENPFFSLDFLCKVDKFTNVSNAYLTCCKTTAFPRNPSRFLFSIEYFSTCRTGSSNDQSNFLTSGIYIFVSTHRLLTKQNHRFRW